LLFKLFLVIVLVGALVFNSSVVVKLLLNDSESRLTGATGFDMGSFTAMSRFLDVRKLAEVPLEAGREARGGHHYMGLLDAIRALPAFRGPDEQAKVQECFRKEQGYGYFVHMRKAGGSSVRRYLEAAATRNPKYHIYVTEGRSAKGGCGVVSL
jgi:hypothetical protein